VRRHCTQAPALHTGAAAGQSELTRQSTHVLSVAQSFPVCVAQSEFARHSTQTDSLVLQAGVFPAHCDADVQPAMHVNVRGLQIGLATPQSPLPRHATQRPVGPKQRGVPDAQSESPAQATHWRVVASQIVFAPVQSPFEAHPMHALVPESHTGLALGQSEAAVHAT
jgi:hypothetical protein